MYELSKFPVDSSMGIFNKTTAGERKVPVHLCKVGAALCWRPEVSFIKHLTWHAWHGRGVTSNIYRNRKWYLG